MEQSSSKKTTARSVLGQSGNLFVVIKYGFFGALCLFFGGLFLWAGLSGPFNGQTVGAGVVALAFGILLLVARLPCLANALRGQG